VEKDLKPIKKKIFVLNVKKIKNNPDQDYSLL
jgi:hypothetical protein